MVDVYLDQATSPTDIVLTPNTGFNLKLGTLPTADPGETDAVWKDDRGTLKISPSGPEIGAASETVAGLVELATISEALAGIDTVRAVTPAGMNTTIAAIPAVAAATATSSGVVELATNAEAVAGVDMTRAVTAAGVAAVVAGIGAPDAVDVVFMPTGDIAATDVQAAIAELDTEKASVTDVATDLALKADTVDVDTALALKADTTDVDTALALKADITDVDADLALKAPLASPTFTGTPIAPTATPGTDDTQIATTAFVQSAVATGTGGVTAADVAFVPAGSIAATDIQAAIAELDSETQASLAAVGLADGDKGEITVSGGGLVWTIDNGVVTYAKLQDVSAAAKLLGRGDSGSGVAQEITLGTGLTMTGTTLAAAGGGGAIDGAVTAVIDGGGAVITPGVKGYIGPAPYDCTLTQADLIADQTGSIIVDVWKCTYAQFDAGATHPVAGDKITSSTPPTISSGTKSTDVTLASWITALAEGDILAFSVTSVTSLQRVMLTLKHTR